MENYLEINFEKNFNMLSNAIKYCEENFLHDDLIKELSFNNDLKKQICIIRINAVYSQKEADLLCFNLINQIGPIRETISYKILDLISNKNFQKFFQTKEILEIFIKSITDINPSVSRNTIQIIKYIDNAEFLYSSIIKEIKETLNDLPAIKNNHSYAGNKKNFSLYWNLEAIISLIDKINPEEELKSILESTALSIDYTIREKTAKTAFLARKKNQIFNSILEQLKNDSNFYVKKYVNL